VILDSGGYSQESLDFCTNHHIFPLIRAKIGLTNQPTREMKKGYYFNTDYIPNGWTDSDLTSAYAVVLTLEKL
jgi:hypothetical protein